MTRINCVTLSTPPPLPLIFGGALIQVRRIAKTGAFEPFVVHYAETFIVPAAAGDYTIRPFGEAEGKECGTIKAFVRTNP